VGTGRAGKPRKKLPLPLTGSLVANEPFQMPNRLLRCDSTGKWRSTGASATEGLRNNGRSSRRRAFVGTVGVKPEPGPLGLAADELSYIYEAVLTTCRVIGVRNLNYAIWDGTRWRCGLIEIRHEVLRKLVLRVITPHSRL